MDVIEQIKTLSRSEALVAMEALWQQLSGNDELLESPEWHREELERRDEAIVSGRATFSTWKEAKERIRKLTK